MIWASKDSDFFCLGGTDLFYCVNLGELHRSARWVSWQMVPKARCQRGPGWIWPLLDLQKKCCNQCMGRKQQTIANQFVQPISTCFVQHNFSTCLSNNNQLVQQSRNIYSTNFHEFDLLFEGSPAYASPRRGRRWIAGCKKHLSRMVNMWKSPKTMGTKHGEI